MAAAPIESPGQQADQADIQPKKLPKGVVLGPDGKPCRSCTSVSSWFAMAKSQTSKDSTAKSPNTTFAAGALTGAATGTSTASTTLGLPESYPSDCPPDVEQLGRAGWTLLHSITASYPVTPSPQLQSETTSFLHTFAKLYPCWWCGKDFQKWMTKEVPRVSSRDEFGKWMCEAHNAVNEKLGKDKFDCERWEERWRTGWRDGRCG